MPKLLDAIKKNINIKEDETLTMDVVEAAITKVSESGKFVPEQKYIEATKQVKALETEKASLEEQVKAFDGVDVEDAKKAKEQLEKLQQEQAKAKEEAEAAAKAAADEAHNVKVDEAVIAKLKEAGAIDAELVVSKVVDKLGGADKVEFNTDGTLKTDIVFAIEHVKSQHATNFSEVKAGGGASGAGAGGGASQAWTPESASEKMSSMTDQEAIDLAREDSDFAKASGLTSYATKEE